MSSKFTCHFLYVPKEILKAILTTVTPYVSFDKDSVQKTIPQNSLTRNQKRVQTSREKEATNYTKKLSDDKTQRFKSSPTKNPDEEKLLSQFGKSIKGCLFLFSLPAFSMPDIKDSHHQHYVSL